MANSDGSMRQAGQSVQGSVDSAEEERRKKLLNYRLDVARRGIVAFKNNQLMEAVNSFHQYLMILEEVKNVAEGGLSPACFDVKKDIAELLMISGVYWDLAKLYDRTASKSKNKEMLHYLEKYIIFSKGMPFQKASADAIQKYISRENPKHVEAFQSAYKILAQSKCFVVTSCMDVIDPMTLPILQDYRDQVLARSRLGRILIRIYYQVGPGIAWVIQTWPTRWRRQAGRYLDRIAQSVNQSSNAAGAKDKLAVRKTDPER
jgi:hypothetical protein